MVTEASALAVYLDLEACALAADERSEDLAEAYRVGMDTVWCEHLTAPERQQLNARPALGAVDQGQDSW